MRQGKAFSKCAMECDIINAEMGTFSEGGITSSVIVDGGPISGVVVGAINVIMNNSGQKGLGKSPFAPSKTEEIPTNDLIMGGLNWRSYGIDRPSEGDRRSLRRNRPRNSVRARPLSECAPELSNALQAAHDHHTGRAYVSAAASLRSLSTLRGGDTSHTLSYDDVLTLFKRFQGICLLQRKRF
jgi:hypothetical protein